MCTREIRNDADESLGTNVPDSTENRVEVLLGFNEHVSVLVEHVRGVKVKCFGRCVRSFKLCINVLERQSPEENAEYS